MQVEEENYGSALTFLQKALDLCPSKMKFFKDSVSIKEILMVYTQYLLIQLQIVSSIIVAMNNLAVIKDKKGDHSGARNLFKQILIFSIKNDEGTANTTDLVSHENLI